MHRRVPVAFRQLSAEPAKPAVTLLAVASAMALVLLLVGLRRGIAAQTAACSAQIVFPDFGLSVDLPAFVELAIDLPAAEPGDYRFCCQMDMLQGRLVVDPVGELTAAAEEAVAA